MRIVYHLGAHCTDEERLIRCLLKNRVTLAAQGILVPAPTRYRRLLRDTAVQLKGAASDAEIQTIVMEQLVEDSQASRVVLSWDSFLSFPQWVLNGQMYTFAGERIRAFTRILPQNEAEFHLALRNPATFVPALFEKQRARPYEDFIRGTYPAELRWSLVVRQILAQNPGVPLVVWCDEDTPLIWPEVLQAVSGHADGTELTDTDELLAAIMSPEGLAQLKAYLVAHPPASIQQRRRIVAAFLDKYALPERVEMSFDLPGWTAELVEDITAAYYEDVALIRQMPGVTFIAP